MLKKAFQVFKTEIQNLHEEGKSASEIRDLIIRGEWKSVKLE